MSIQDDIFDLQDDLKDNPTALLSLDSLLDHLNLVEQDNSELKEQTDALKKVLAINNGYKITGPAGKQTYIHITIEK